MPGPSCGMWDLVPQQESNLGPLEQERGVLAVGPGGMSQESLLRSQVRIGVAGYVISLYRVLWLAGDEVTGWSLRNQHSQSLGTRRLGAVSSWSSLTWHLPFVGGRGCHVCKTQEMCIKYCHLSNRYFREELKQRVWGRPVPVLGRPGEVLLSYNELDRIPPHK